MEKIRSVLNNEGIEISGIVPMDENIAIYDVIGKSIFDLPEESPSVKSVKEIMTTLYA